MRSVAGDWGMGAKGDYGEGRTRILGESLRGRTLCFLYIPSFGQGRGKDKCVFRTTRLFLRLFSCAGG